MLEINSETVRFIISKTHEFQNNDGNSSGDDTRNPLESEILESPARSNETSVALEFRSVIDDLEPDQQQALVALMWLGRGDYSMEEWDEALEEARVSWTLHTADYLLSTPLLGDYLEEGLVLHGYESD